MKLVIDTNTLISGSLWAGPSAQLLDLVADGKAELVLSPDLLAEFAAVITRPKFVERITARGTTANELARKLSEKVAIVAQVPLAPPKELRDPKDLPVLACAVAARREEQGDGRAGLRGFAAGFGVGRIAPAATAGKTVSLAEDRHAACVAGANRASGQ